MKFTLDLTERELNTTIEALVEKLEHHRDVEHNKGKAKVVKNVILQLSDKLYNTYKITLDPYIEERIG